MQNIFEDFSIAMVQPSKYSEFLKRKTAAVSAFVIILVLVTSLATVLYPLVTIGRMANEFYTYDVPYFKIENGVMTADDEFELKSDMVFLGISDKKDYKEDVVTDYKVAMLFDKDGFVIKNYGQLTSAKYTEFGPDLKVDKDFIYMFKNFFIIIMIVSGIILLMFNFAGFFFGAWIISWITKGLIRVYNVDITSKKHYVLCMYSRTVPVILSALLGLVNFVLPYVISIIISVIYVKRALFFMRQEIKEPINTEIEENENEDDNNE